MRRERTFTQELGLEMGLGRDRFAEPRLDLVPPGLGDRVALAIGTGSGFSLTDQRLPVPRETGERRVRLTERQGLPRPK